MFAIYIRRTVEVNTDPLRRCYHGVHAKSEMQKTQWGEIGNRRATREEAEKDKQWWESLNQYAVDARGESARCEYKVQEIPDEAA